jgi:hypothetical protein
MEGQEAGKLIYYKPFSLIAFKLPGFPAYARSALSYFTDT